jgi:hypothetical protein
VIGLFVEVPEMSSEKAAQVNNALNLGGKPPKGQVFHAEGPMEGGGTRVVDIWESQESLDTFMRNQLGPVFQRLNIPMPQPVIWPISLLLR